MPEVLESSVPAEAQPVTLAPRKMPDIKTFKEIVTRHCEDWNVVSVSGLCPSQTFALIEELSKHFG